MYCDKCGKPVEDGSVFCENCGARLPAPAEKPEAAPSAPAQAPSSASRPAAAAGPYASAQPAPAPAKKRIHPAIIAVAAVCAAALLAGGVFGAVMLVGKLRSPQSRTEDIPVVDAPSWDEDVTAIYCDGFTLPELTVKQRFTEGAYYYPAGEVAVVHSDADFASKEISVLRRGERTEVTRIIEDGRSSDALLRYWGECSDGWINMSDLTTDVYLADDVALYALAERLDKTAWAAADGGSWYFVREDGGFFVTTPEGRERVTHACGSVFGIVMIETDEEYVLADLSLADAGRLVLGGSVCSRTVRIPEPATEPTSSAPVTMPATTAAPETQPVTEAPATQPVTEAPATQPVTEAAPSWTPVSLVVGSAVPVNLRPGAGNLLNLREGPGYDYPVLTTIPNGTYVTVSAVDGGWGKVAYGGYEGWVDITVAGWKQ